MLCNNCFDLAPSTGLLVRLERVHTTVCIDLLLHATNKSSPACATTTRLWTSSWLRLQYIHSAREEPTILSSQMPTKVGIIYMHAYAYLCIPMIISMVSNACLETTGSAMAAGENRRRVLIVMVFTVCASNIATPPKTVGAHDDLVVLVITRVLLKGPWRSSTHPLPTPQ